MCVDGNRSCENCALGDAAEPALMKRMADALGVDALLKGEDRAAAADRCFDCTDENDCEDWLATAEIRGADHAPGFCRNTDVFEELASEVPNGF